MPEEDKANILTPIDRRRRQRTAALVFGLFLALVLAGLATTVLAVNNGRNYQRLVREFGLENYLLPARPPPDLRIGRQKAQPPAGHYPPWLLRAGLERSAVFERALSLSAEERCDRLANERGIEPAFTGGDDEWECLFFEEFGTSAEPASLFVQARGKEPDVVRILRLKLSLLDPPAERSVLDAAIAALQRFGLPMTPETRTYLADKILARTDFTSIVENYRMTFSREMTDARRYNLLIQPDLQTVACGEPPPTPPGRGNTPTYPMPVGCLALRGIPAQPQSAT
ncbi:DUF6030 family protein [Neorhizobium sp. CSC1952]|uniref:DUF6030 family protein n=1 Tax=Neorhizobium sp. CSC1952 TaxID=2978974 RepID=UPI0025A575E2|nr:DUF6030 family protein [Rhizobium sp. CSC1952]WJR67352.1 DUF6030 family protein [Rhizobium sp. CSC1952]